MTLIVIIFSLSILTAFGMLLFRAWEIRTSQIEIDNNKQNILKEIPFRHLEKNMLYFIKHLIQGIVFIIAKYWFIFIAKIKKIINGKWQKNGSVSKKNINQNSYRHSFFSKAILESKAKIKHIREKVREEINPEDVDKNS
ncbi:MAG: hypothetical protein PHT84_03280 [Candidatus Pacebacteria bacterium]|nr:hypothetical protein [Candidatus Paceibacterota bacterium]